MAYVSEHIYFTQTGSSLSINGVSVNGAYSDGSTYSSTFGTLDLASSSFTHTITPGALNITAAAGSSCTISPTAFSFNNPAGAFVTLTGGNNLTLGSNLNASNTVVSNQGISVNVGSGASVSITAQFQLTNAAATATGTFSSTMLSLNLASGNSFTYQNAGVTIIGASGTTTTTLNGATVSTGTLSLGGTAVSSFGASLAITSGVVQVAYGTALNTAAQGNDTRITGALQSTNLPASAALLGSGTGGSFTSVSVGTLGLAITAGVLNPTYGTAANTFAQGNDTRITGAYQSASFPVNAPLLASGAAGTITSVSIGTLGLAITTGVLNPTYGTAANTFAQGNDARITGALQSTNLPANSALLASGAAGTFSAVTVPAAGGLVVTAGALSVVYGTAASTAAQGNDTRITGALQSANLPANSALLASGAAGTFSAITVPAAGGLVITTGSLSVVYGTAASTAAQGNDARITGALQQANVAASAPLLASNSGKTITAVSVGTLGIAITAGVLNPTYGTVANTFAQGNDTRITGAFQSSSFPVSAALLASGAAGTITAVSLGSNISITSGVLNAATQVSVTGQDVLVYSGGNLSAAILDPYVANYWYASRPQADSTTVTATSVSGTTGQLFCLPIEIRQRSQIKGIACRVTTAGVASSVRMGLYSNAGGTLGTSPLTLLVDGGVATATTSTGAAAVTISSGPTLAVGTYHLAIEIVAQGSTVAVFSGSAPCPELTSIYGANTAVISLGSANYAGIQAGNGVVNTGALPSTFPTPTVLTAAAAPLLSAQLLPV